MQYCFSFGIVFNTHRLTINVAQFTVVSESHNKSYNVTSLTKTLLPRLLVVALIVGLCMDVLESDNSVEDVGKK